MRTGTANNYTQFSKNWGGVRKAYEGHEAPWMLTGGFKFPSLDVLPASGNVLPAFTPVKADEQARTIVPLYVFEVKSVDAEHNTITVLKNEEGTRAKVGMKLIVAPDDYKSAASNLITVTAVDSSASDVDVLTVDAVTSGGTTSYSAVAKDDLFVVVTPEAGDNPYSEGWYIKSAANTYVKCTDTDTSVVSETVYAASKSPKALGLYEDNAGATATTDTEVNLTKTYYEKVITPGTAFVTAGNDLIEAGTDKKIKVIPNTLMPYDTCVDEDAFALDGEACWGATSPILERRIVKIPAIIKKALKDADCVFRFSNRK